MFSMQHNPALELKLDDVTVNPVSVEWKISRFDLTLYLNEDSNRLSGVVEYNTDLFDSSTIERLVGHYEILLDSIAADPNRRISDLPLLTEAEHSQLLVEWNATKADYPKDKCIHQLFEEQTVQTPDALALVFEDRRLTYRELDVRANKLARYLQQRDVGPGLWSGYASSVPSS